MSRTRRRSFVALTALLTVTAALGPTPTSPAAASPRATGPAPAAVPVESWTVDLAVTGGDDVNVRRHAGLLGLADARPAARTRAAAAAAPVAEGTLLTPPRTLTRPATRVDVRLAARTADGGTARAQVRGRRAGTWTEWRDGGTVLFGRPVTRVQARVLLTAARPGSVTTVSGLRLTARRVAAQLPQPALSGTPLTYRVFATREGNVGDLTANGHTIVPRDHFVALPSRRALSPLDTGDYTAKVCTTSASRCEYAPVWDVGPWNTRDDYWNPSSVRENWKDLPQGRPEAQAAYQYGYHGGRDQFGRTVLNPAGIDLADGTFWDGLLLADNAWVDVTYLWTAGGLAGRVGSGPLNIRTGPSTAYAVRGLAATYANVPIQCYVLGQTISGPYGTTSRWDRLATGQYVSHAYLSAVYGGTVPLC